MKIEIIRFHADLYKEELEEHRGRPQGVIGEFEEEKTGTYQFTNGDEVYIEMEPKEAAEKGLFIIALTSLLFKGHKRSEGYFGKERRLVVIGKNGVGSVQLSSYESLRVTLKNSFQGNR